MCFIYAIRARQVARIATSPLCLGPAGPKVAIPAELIEPAEYHTASTHEVMLDPEKQLSPAGEPDGAKGVATGRVELPTFRFSVERSTS